MDVITGIELALKVIGGLVTILAVIAPFTKNTWDDKILLALKSGVSNIKLNKEDKTVLIQIK